MANEKTYTVAKVTTARPSMNTPEIKINAETITITDPLNGSFLGGYKIYSDGKYLTSVGRVTSVDLGTLTFPAVSSYEIKIRAFSDYFNDSPDSNTVTFSMKGYDKLENEFGTTAVITANYRIEINPKKKTAEVCTLF